MYSLSDWWSVITKCEWQKCVCMSVEGDRFPRHCKRCKYTFPFAVDLRAGQTLEKGKESLGIRSFKNYCATCGKWAMSCSLFPQYLEERIFDLIRDCSWPGQLWFMTLKINCFFLVPLFWGYKNEKSTSPCTMCFTGVEGRGRETVISKYKKLF